MNRRRIYELIESEPKDDCKAKTVFEWFLMGLICLNVVAVVFASVNEFYDRHRNVFAYFEFFSIVIFTAEYLLRLWIAPHKFPSSKNAYLRYIFSFMGMIDLLSILPFYLPFVMNVDLRSLRILRMFRLLRVLKLTRYNEALELIVRVLHEQKEKLKITFFFMLMMLLLASSAMYFAENAVQPDRFPNIPATLWWTVATLTTVGYGDVYPITIAGRLLGGVIAVMGIGLIAMPSGIISMGLIQEVKKEKKEGTDDESD